LRCDCATTTVTRSITVAEGVFAPGHLGELTQHIPFELVDAVLAETGALQRRLRQLPSRVGVYFLLALGLFPHLGYVKVWGKLVRGLADLAVPRPCEKALRDLRRRLGAAPIKALFEVLAGPLAQPATPGVRYRCWRTVAFDGCSSIKVPDAERNRGWLGKVRYRLGWAGYPTLMLMTLVETGTRGLLGAVFGPCAGGEKEYAHKLLPLLGADHLVLIDRGFDGNDFLEAVAATGAKFLARAKSTRRPPVTAKLPDGSFLSLIGALTVRVIDADLVVTGADGTAHTARYRLITTLLDHCTDPASRLLRLYCERWEIESAYYALRHTLLDGHVLRSGDPVGLEQELWAQLALYQVLRIAMVAAVESAPGTDADRASFTTAVEAARDQVTAAAGVIVSGEVDLVGVIGRAVLADLLPARRLRFSARKVKSPISRYHARPADDDRPLTSTDITAVAATIHEPPAESAPAVRVPGYFAKAAAPPAPTGPPPGPGSRKEDVLALLRADPQRSWHGRDLARTLGIDNLNSFCVQISQWAHKGLLRKTGRARYTLAC
jgi:hypothetical protein